MTTQPSRTVLRYQLGQRLVHWMGAAGFVALLLTGLVLLWSPLSPLAAGGWSRMLHRLGAVLYILWPILYAILNPHAFAETVRDSLTFTKDDVAWFKHIFRYSLGDASNLPAQGRVNPGQKLHHIGVGLMSAGVVVSGLVLWLAMGRLSPANLALVASIHNFSMLVLTVLLIGHVYFTFVYGALDGMLKGRVTEAYARMEHPKWVATLPESAFLVDDASQAPAAPTTEGKDRA